MSSFRLHDWNDARLLIACAECGSFARAGALLGIDQSTVSRRISALEASTGRPLFTRRRSGAAPTPAGLALLERARQMEQAAAQFEFALRGLSTQPAARVTLAASEGLLTYTLIPALLGHAKAELPLDRRLIQAPLPDLAFTTAPDQADIAVLATSPGDLPTVKGAMRVRRVGTMHFIPVAARRYLEDHPPPDDFAQLIEHPLLDIGFYRLLRGLDDWNGLIARRCERGAPVLVAPTTPRLHQPLLAGEGISLLPDYATLYEPNLLPVTLSSCPPLGASLWLVSHEDTLREPAVRTLYDLLATMFLSSSWYRRD